MGHATFSTLLVLQRKILKGSGEQFRQLLNHRPGREKRGPGLRAICVSGADLWVFVNDLIK